MKHLKTFFNIHKILAILILSLVFIFLIPLIINGLYQIPAPCPIPVSYTHLTLPTIA